MKLEQKVEELIFLIRAQKSNNLKLRANQKTVTPKEIKEVIKQLSDMGINESNLLTVNYTHTHNGRPIICMSLLMTANTYNDVDLGDKLIKLVSYITGGDLSYQLWALVEKEKPTIDLIMINIPE